MNILIHKPLITFFIIFLRRNLKKWDYCDKGHKHIYKNFDYQIVPRNVVPIYSSITNMLMQKPCKNKSSFLMFFFPRLIGGNGISLFWFIFLWLMTINSLISDQFLDLLTGFLLQMLVHFLWSFFSWSFSIFLLTW